MVEPIVNVIDVTIVPSDGLCIINGEQVSDKELFNTNDFPFHALQYHNETLVLEPSMSEANIVKYGEDGYNYNNYIVNALTKFNNKGEIIIRGYVEIGGCCIIDNVGVIELDGANRIADGSQLFIREKLSLGKGAWVGFHGFIMDSDDHFTIDVELKKVANNKRPIKIGKGCWLGSSTFVKKGTILPDYTIVASANALLTKDYTGIPPYTVLGGSPAKPLKSGIRRIELAKFERELKHYFKANPNEKYYQCDENANIEELCTQEGADF